MTNKEKRELVSFAVLSRENENQYSQDLELRVLVDKGYGDCSSTMRWAYLSTLKIDIGQNTVSQIQSKLGKTIDIADGSCPNESKLEIGDLIFFKGSDESRPFGVGHVEMYIGKNKLIGHGSGTGPNIKNLKEYCESRYEKGRGYIKAVRFINTEDKYTPTTPVYHKIVKGDTLNKLATKYKTTVNKIIELNSIKNPNMILIGHKLLVKGTLYHTVTRGETLTKIATKYKTTVKKLVELNSIKNPNSISIGQKLIIK